MANVFFEIFEALPRQGPGSEEATRQAYGKLCGLPRRANILDVGCGSGAQTLVLAQLTTGEIAALDNHAPFIEALRREIDRRGLSTRVRCVNGDMGAMSFAEGSFDLIWSEGSAYNIGFENALNSWKVFLRPGGYLVASELVWFTKQAPPEITDYFGAQYPEMKHYEDIVAMIRSAGYELTDYFPLPSKAWWTDYYTPAQKTIANLRQKYPGDPEAKSILDSFELEMEMHRRYSEYYGYGFYLIRK
jgi:SAM-dependent methyltransferase